MKGANSVGDDPKTIERVRALCDDAQIIVRRVGNGYELRGRNVHLIVKDLRQVEESDLTPARNDDID